VHFVIAGIELFGGNGRDVWNSTTIVRGAQRRRTGPEYLPILTELHEQYRLLRAFWVGIDYYEEGQAGARRFLQHRAQRWRDQLAGHQKGLPFRRAAAIIADAP